MKPFSQYASDTFKFGMSEYLSRLKRDKSKNDYITVLNDLMDFCQKDFLEISSDDAFSFLHKLEEDANHNRIKWNTLNNKMARLHTISNYFVQQDYFSDYNSNPFDNPHRLNQNRMLHSGQILSLSEIDQFLSYAKSNDNLYLASCMVLRMGLTSTELTNLRLSHFFLSDGSCYLKLPRRTILVPGDIKNLLDHMVKKNQLSDYLLIKSQSSRLTLRELQLLCQQVPMNVTFPILRNTCIAYAFKGGAVTSDICDYLGITDAWLYRFDEVVSDIHYPAMPDFSNIRIVNRDVFHFRVHHILCTNLYQGYGYSGAFCDNMTEKITWLKAHPDEPLCLVTDPDEICQKCPNLVQGIYCTDEKNHVQKKDEALLERLHLKKNGQYTYRQLIQHADRYLTKEIFEQSCKNCEWYQKGLCRFEDFDYSGFSSAE